VTFKGVASITGGSFLLGVDWHKVVLELVLDELLVVEDLSQVLFGVVIKLP
jgi:hypothetical protein